MLKNDPLLQALFWSVMTIAFYAFGKELHHRRPCFWTSPLVVAPLLLILAALSLHVTYGQYISGTHWLVGMLAPATVAFAIPIYEERVLISYHWPLLIMGVLVGSVISMLSSWGLADLLGLSRSLRLSLLPRSVTTPFAMIISGDIGGVPQLTAVFVLITGVLGVTIGEVLLSVLPLQSALARGVLLGMGAHAVGTAKGHQIDKEVGAIAGLVMVLVGLLNVLAAPLLGHLLAAIQKQ